MASPYAALSQNLGVCATTRRLWYVIRPDVPVSVGRCHADGPLRIIMQGLDTMGRGFLDPWEAVPDLVLDKRPSGLINNGR